MKNIKQIIKNSYGRIARQNGSCCGGGGCCGSSSNYDDVSNIIGYTDDQVTQVPDGANLGLGCGNPLAITSLQKGEVVLDLGSGAGFDVFLAARKVGDSGKVIGVDMTVEMIKKAEGNAIIGSYDNVEFRLGDIEDLPIDNNSIDVIISNCVINLAPDKEKVFKEAYRVLRKGGRMMISDVVLSKALPKNIKEDDELLTGCVSGAILKKDYLELLNKTGFTKISISKEIPMFLDGYALSITYEATK